LFLCYFILAFLYICPKLMNMERLIAQYRALIEKTDTRLVRYLHVKINWKNRIIAILGARGVGKTTLLLQHIKLNCTLQKSLYVSADDFYFSSNTLFDLASQFHMNGGEHLFIDEIHKYPNWSKEIKMMYDNIPHLKIIITGSSILDLYKGTDDLSRRVIRYTLKGLSFREYLNLINHTAIQPYSLEQIVNNSVELNGIEFPLMHFKNYLKHGYYPFFNEPDYEVRLNNILNMTIETDIPMYAKMNVGTAIKMKQLLSIIAKSVPFKPNATKIAELVDVHRNQIVEFLHYFESAGIIMQLREKTQGIRAIGKTEKIYLDNPNLMYAIGSQATNIGNVRETFFLNQMKLDHSVFSHDNADFQIENAIFEVGGRSKTKKQLAGLSKAYLVKDDILFGYQNSIPLWHFGMSY
jgi:predicted AAA+ superfamily ATPase